MKKMKLMLESYFEAPKTIKELRLSWGYFIGGFIGVVILLFFYWISSYIGGWIFNKIADVFNVQEYIGIFKWVITFIVRTVMFAVEYFFFKTLLLGILAPFFSYISEKVENFQDGVKYEFSLKENILFVMRGIKIASKSFIKEMIYTLIPLLLGFVPVLNLVTPILIFLIQSYFISYNFVDYTLERRKFSVEESTKFMRENRAVFTLGDGIFTLIYFVPIIGIIIAPIVGIVAFTTVTLKILKLKNVVRE